MTINLHKPIMKNEILSFIDGEKNLSILDCTFGGGGHSKSFLENGHRVTAIDQDEKSLNIANELKIFSPSSTVTPKITLDLSVNVLVILLKLLSN